MRECIRCKSLCQMSNLTQMSGSIWLHNDLEICDVIKQFAETGE